MKTKPLKYTLIVDLNDHKTSHTFTSYNKAKEYSLKASNQGFDSLLHVTRGNDFEYEIRFYAFSESQKTINALPKQ